MAGKSKRAIVRWWTGATRLMRVAAIGAVLAGAVTAGELAGGAFAQTNPTNDLFAIGLGSGDTPAAVPVVHRPEPPFVATPAPTSCGPGSHPEPGIDGRVPAGTAANSLSCNVTLVGHQGTEGGFKVFRYIDTQGHECAFYDTTLMFPLNALNPGGGSVGRGGARHVGPGAPGADRHAHHLPMLSPHESLNLNPKRGLLAAVNGNLATEPGFFSIYDVHDDCRHPVLDADGPYARFGHESGFSADGKTFYATSTALQSITAIDVSNPKEPHAIWQGNEYSHGMTLSDDGNRAYIADPKGQPADPRHEPDPGAQAGPAGARGRPAHLELGLDPAERDPVHRERPSLPARVRRVQPGDAQRPATRTWSARRGSSTSRTRRKPRVIAPTSACESTSPPTTRPRARRPGREEPRAGLRGPLLQHPHARSTRRSSPARSSPPDCACSTSPTWCTRRRSATTSRRPTPRAENGYMASDFAMSKPAFVPERHEVWFTDGTSGFYVLRVADSVWPQDNGSPPQVSLRSPARSSCSARRRLLVKLPPTGTVRATLAGKRLRVVRRGRSRYAVADLRRVKSGTARLTISVRPKHGRVRKTSRVYRLCPSAQRTTVKASVERRETLPAASRATSVSR